MFDIVFPRDDERQFVLMAKQLGYAGLIFVYPDKKLVKKADYGLDVKYAVLCPPNKISSVNDSGMSSFCKGSEKARDAIERSASIIFGVEDERKDSVHYRRSGLNQVLCKLMRDKGVALGFSFADVLSCRGWRRSIMLGRMMQNIRLCRKFKVKMVVGSFASDPMRMRSPDDLRAFFHVLGMTKEESK